MPRNNRKTKPPMPAGPVADGHNLDETVAPRKPMTAEPVEPIELEEPAEPTEPGEPTEPAEPTVPEEETEPAEEETEPAAEPTEPETTEPVDK